MTIRSTRRSGPATALVGLALASLGLVDPVWSDLPSGFAPVGTVLAQAMPPHDPSGPAPQRTEVAVSTAGELAQAIGSAGAHPGLTILLAAGEYHLTPAPFVDPSCGNCEDPDQAVPVTVGLRMSGQDLTLRGSTPDSVILHTHAGYGLLIEDCRDCRLERVTLTGGIRDTAAMASDAAVVVRRSTLTIEDCTIGPNLGDSAVVAKTVSGVMGICGREGSHIHLLDSRIVGNSWDGIALYRDAFAHIENCLIDGIDSGRSGPASGGRGVALGITWNARAVVVGNLIRRYWKGIGIFVDAEAEVRENIVEDVLTWGISLWDAGRGTPYAEIVHNAVYETGACGISVTRGRPGGRGGSRIVGNAIARSGQNIGYDSPDSYCTQEALAVQAVTADMTIGPNWFAENREAGDLPGRFDLPADRFLESTRRLRDRLTARASLRDSRFLATGLRSRPPSE
jgi:hypothetical protein